jgi:uncharacterized membrane protein
MFAPQAVKSRLQILDAMRGFAIVIMILDHALSALESLGIQSDVVEYSRLSVTRFSMPLFMIASGIAWGRFGLRFQRWAQVLIWGLVINSMTRLLWPEFNFPEILAIWAALAIVWKLIQRFPIITMIIGYTQTTYWQIPWQGFQPGELAIFLGVGVLLSKVSLDFLWRERRTSRLLKPLAVVGRYPLTIYGSHLIAVTIIVGAINNEFTSLF